MTGARVWMLGVRSLRLHPLRSLLTVLGILVGVASVIWLLAIGHGISTAVAQQIEGLGADNIIVRSIKPARGAPRRAARRLRRRLFRRARRLHRLWRQRAEQRPVRADSRFVRAIPRERCIRLPRSIWPRGRSSKSRS